LSVYTVQKDGILCNIQKDPVLLEDGVRGLREADADGQDPTMPPVFLEPVEIAAFLPEFWFPFVPELADVEPELSEEMSTMPSPLSVLPRLLASFVFLPDWFIGLYLVLWLKGQENLRRGRTVVDGAAQYST